MGCARLAAGPLADVTAGPLAEVCILECPLVTNLFSALFLVLLKTTSYYNIDLLCI